MNNFKSKQSRTVIMFLIVPMLLIFFFVFIPFALMFFFSFTNWDGFSTSYSFVGINNYFKLFKADNLEPFKLIFYYGIGGIFQLIIGVYLAVFVYFQKRFKKLMIIITILPIFINTVAVGLIFLLFFQPSGMFDQIITVITFGNYQPGTILWIGNQQIINITLVIIAIWRFTSFTFLLTLSGLNSVDEKLVKAAYQSGANKYQITRYILLPNIRITLNLIITMLIIGSITVLEIPMVISQGALKTKTILMRLNEVAFLMRDYGLASVISLVIGGLILVILVICLRKGVENAKD